MPAKEFLVVGRVIRPHGIRGAVVVEPESDFPGRFREGAILLLETGPGIRKEVDIRSCTPHKGRFLVTISGITSVEEAESIRGCYFYIRGEDAAPLGEGEYWVHDLLGMVVRDGSGRRLGVVENLMPGKAQDLLEVRDDRGRLFQVPLVEEFVKEVRVEKSEIVVEPIEGMLP